MFKKRFCRLLLLLLAASPLASFGFTNSNKVRFEVHFAPNFISSIYSVGEIGFKKAPGLTYVDISTSDKETLQQERKLIEFGNGDSGHFTFPAYFLPCYLNVNSADEYKEYVSALKKALLANNFDQFLKRYPVNFEDVFMKENLSFFTQSKRDWETYTKPRLEQFFKVVDIFAKYASEYEQRFWNEDKHVLLEKANYFNAYFEKQDIIGKWEQLLGKNFNGDYRIYLCLHNSYGPDANSICFDRNIFCAMKYENRVIDFVSHEVGTHLFFEEAFLNDGLKNLRKDNYRVFYAAFESLAMFLNGKIMGKPVSYSLDNFRAKEFGEIYAKVYQPNVTVEAMIHEGVAQMSCRWK